MTRQRKRILATAGVMVLVLSAGFVLWRNVHRIANNKPEKDLTEVMAHTAVTSKQSPRNTDSVNYDSRTLAELRARVTGEAGGKGIVALEGAEARAKYKDPFEFIAAGWHSGLPYEEAHEWVDPASLPRLRAALEDPQQSASWPKIAQMIGYIGEDAQSARDLLEYVRRSEDWSSLNPSHHFHRVVGKVKALLWVGKIGDKDSVAALREALTEAGAKDLAKDWIRDPLPTWAQDKDNLMALIRGTAAIGLVHSQDPEGLRLVEQEYERMHADRIKGSPESEYYNHLVSAMAIRDMIRDLGKQGYLNLLGSAREVDEMSPYLRRYDWFWQQREETK